MSISLGQLLVIIFVLPWILWLAWFVILTVLGLAIELVRLVAGPREYDDDAGTASELLARGRD